MMEEGAVAAVLDEEWLARFVLPSQKLVAQEIAALAVFIRRP